MNGWPDAALIGSSQPLLPVHGRLQTHQAAHCTIIIPRTPPATPQVELPCKLSPTEWEIITRVPDPPSSIILLGRSGTGKTTCAVYRMWSKWLSGYKEWVPGSRLAAAAAAADAAAAAGANQGAQVGELVDAGWMLGIIR
jgi:hypothetical protein